MIVECQRCATTHDVSPPPWVLASGKPFRFTCSACGHVAMVAQSKEPAAPPPAETAWPGREPTPAPPWSHPLADTALDDDEVGGEEEDDGLAPVLAELAGDAGATEDALHALAVDDDEDEDSAADLPVAIPRPPLPTSAAPRLDNLPGDDHDHDAPAPALVGLPGGAFLLRQEDELFNVPDLATLQRWILESRIDPDAELSEDGGPWGRAGDRPDLAIFFAAGARLEREARGEPDLAAAVMAASVGLRPPPEPDHGLDLAPEPDPEPASPEVSGELPRLSGAALAARLGPPPEAMPALPRRPPPFVAPAEPPAPPAMEMSTAPALADLGLLGDLLDDGPSEDEHTMESNPHPTVEVPFTSDEVVAPEPVVVAPPTVDVGDDAPTVGAFDAEDALDPELDAFAATAPGTYPGSDAMDEVAPKPASSGDAVTWMVPALVALASVVAIVVLVMTTTSGPGSKPSAPAAPASPPAVATPVIAPPPATPPAATPPAATPPAVAAEAATPSPVAAEAAPSATPASTPRPTPTPPAAPTPRPTATPSRLQPVPSAITTTASPTPQPTPRATPTPQPTPRPPPAGVPSPWDAPEVRGPSSPAPTPPPAPAASRSVSELVEAGWSALDARRLGEATSLFQQAVTKDGGSPEANFGLGYALAEQGRAAEAKGPLCRALPRASGIDQAEIRATLSRLGITCN